MYFGVVGFVGVWGVFDGGFLFYLFLLDLVFLGFLGGLCILYWNMVEIRELGLHSFYFLENQKIR